MYCAAWSATAGSLSARRAWIEIGAAIPQRVHVTQSLSARRAWIEIPERLPLPRWHPVALRKESVDRNRPQPPGAAAPQVALRKESVDRNGNAQVSGDARVCRSPQGERG